MALLCNQTGIHVTPTTEFEGPSPQQLPTRCNWGTFLITLLMYKQPVNSDCGHVEERCALPLLLWKFAPCPTIDIPACCRVTIGVKEHNKKSAQFTSRSKNCTNDY